MLRSVRNPAVGGRFVPAPSSMDGGHAKIKGRSPGSPVLMFRLPKPVADPGEGATGWLSGWRSGEEGRGTSALAYRCGGSRSLGPWWPLLRSRFTRRLLPPDTFDC